MKTLWQSLVVFSLLAGSLAVAESSGYRNIHEAVTGNDLAGVKGFLEEGVSVNAVDTDYRTPLYLAARGGRIAMMKVLLENGADVNAADRQGNTPLLATRVPDAINLLLEHGADINARNNLGNTLLHSSIFYPSVVNLLLKKGADIHLANNQGQTVLDIASIAGRTEIATLLIQRGADITEPLHTAAYQGQVDVVKGFLASGADVNTRDEDNNTIMHKAFMMRQAQPDMIKLLLEHGADVNAVNDAGETPLYHAALTWGAGLRLRTCAMLIEAGADVNAETRAGATPFLALLSRGGDLRHGIPDNSPYLRLVNLFLENGAELHKRYRGERTPLHHAAATIRNYRIIELMIAKGLEVNAKDNGGNTPLHLAASETQTRVQLNAEMLIRYGADVNARNNNGQTPLHLAANAGSIRVAGQLITNGAEINAKDNNDRTPLQMAEARNHAVVVEFLKEKR